MTTYIPTWFEFYWHQNPLNQQEIKKTINKLIDILFAQTNVKHQNGQWELCLKLNQLSLSLAEQNDDNVRQLKAREKIVTIYKDLGNFKAAQDYCLQALDLALQLKDQALIAGFYNHLGVIANLQGNYKIANDYLEKFLKLANKFADLNNVFGALLNIGVIHADTGSYDLAMKYYQQALDLAIETGNDSNRCYVFNNIGNLLVKLGKNEEALSNFHEMHALSKKIGFRQGVAVALGNLGIIYAQAGEFNLAIANFRKRMEIAIESGDKRGIGFAAGNMGSAYLDDGDIENALVHFDHAIAVHGKIGFKFGLVSWLAGKVICLMEKDKYPEALTYVTDYIELSQELSYSETLMHGRILLAIINARIDPTKEETAIATLEQMLTEIDPSTFQGQEQQAMLHYELWQMTKDFPNLQDLENLNPKNHRQASLEMYQKLYEKIPKFAYKKRIESLIC